MVIGASNEKHKKCVRIKNKDTKRILKISLSLVLITFVLTMSSGQSAFQIIKPVSALALTDVTVVPASNNVKQRATYDIFLKTATTETIKTIQMDFPSSFNLAVANKIIERSGIGPGSLSFTGSTLKYTLDNAESVSAGTDIRLEIGRIIATTTGTFTVDITTLNSVGDTIDGPTTSGAFTIRPIQSPDISPNFMKSKTLLDDDAGHANGWDPDGSTDTFGIIDTDVKAESRIIVNIDDSTSEAVCNTGFIDEEAGFFVDCDTVNVPDETSKLQYTIVNLPDNVITSALSSTASPTSSISPFDSLPEQVVQDKLVRSPSLP